MSCGNARSMRIECRSCTVIVSIHELVQIWLARHALIRRLYVNRSDRNALNDYEAAVYDAFEQDHLSNIMPTLNGNEYVAIELENALSGSADIWTPQSALLLTTTILIPVGMQLFDFTVESVWRCREVRWK